MNVNNPAMQRIRKLQSDLAAAQARIAELETAQAWQPIETAPKDRHILVCGLPHPIDYSSKKQYIEVASWYSREWRIPYKNQPTHWMPLPAPPALTGEPR